MFWFLSKTYTMKRHVRYYDSDYYLCGLKVQENPVKSEENPELCKQCNEVSKALLQPHFKGRHKILKKLELRRKKQ